MGIDRVLAPLLIAAVFCGCSAPDSEEPPGGSGAGPVIFEALRLESDGEIGQALALLTGWAGPPASQSRAFEAAAQIARRQEQPGQAVTYLDHALEGRPHEPVLLYQRGEALLEAGWERQAVDQLRECLIRDKGRRRTRLLLGTVLFEMGRYDEAADCLDPIDPESVADARALILLGSVRFKAGSSGDALALFDRAGRVDPALPDADFNRAVVFEGEKKPDLAEKAYLAALGKDPGHVPSLFNLGRLLWTRGEREEGQRLLDAACDGAADVMTERSMKSTRDRLLAEAEEEEGAGSSTDNTN